MIASISCSVGSPKAMVAIRTCKPAQDQDAPDLSSVPRAISCPPPCSLNLLVEEEVGSQRLGRGHADACWKVMGVLLRSRTLKTNML